MTRVQTNADTRFVCHKVDDLSQLGEFSSDSITLATHVLNNCTKHAQTLNVTQCVKIIDICQQVVNPLQYRGNYSATSNNMTLVHWLLMGGLSHLVQRWGDLAGPQPTQAPHHCTKCNSPPINGQCSPYCCIIVHCSAVFMCPWRVNFLLSTIKIYQYILKLLTCKHLLNICNDW